MINTLKVPAIKGQGQSKETETIQSIKIPTIKGQGHSSKEIF